MNILMVAGESNPFAKGGGLADVVYSLSKELVKKGNNVSIVLPFYKKIKDQHMREHMKEYELVKTFPVYMSWRVQYCGVFRLEHEGITYYFIDNEQYFYRDGLYGFDDDIERFAYFNLAVVEFVLHMQLKLDVIHVHDWQAGMIPLLLKTDFRAAINYYVPHFVLTIHNPAFQGKFDPYYLGDFFNLSDVYYRDGTVRFENCASFLKAAIMLCDKITTVSPTHARELLNGEHAYGLQDVIRLREYDFFGIVNGVDEEEFNPRNDERIFVKYDEKTVLEGKKKNKQELLKKFGIKNPDLPLFGLVSRLTSQKGISLILDAIPHLSGKANIFLLGSGEKELEDRARFLRECYSENVAVYFGYSDDMAHKVYAASDYFLMPSNYEPCGIGQMIAHRYGALPIVRTTGGLKDTVIGFDGNNLNIADGFSFDDYCLQGLLGPCLSALDLFAYRDERKKMMQNAMKKNHSWSTSCELYLGVYREITGKKS